MTAILLNDGDRLMTPVEAKRAALIILRRGIRRATASAIMRDLRSRVKGVT
jgi:hypothetical protein